MAASRPKAQYPLGNLDECPFDCKAAPFRSWCLCDKLPPEKGQNHVKLCLVAQSIDLLFSLVVQHLGKGWRAGYFAKTFIVLTCWGFVSVGTCIADVRTC